MRFFHFEESSPYGVLLYRFLNFYFSSPQFISRNYISTMLQILKIHTKKFIQNYEKSNHGVNHLHTAPELDAH